MWLFFWTIFCLTNVNELFGRKIELIRNTRPIIGIVAQEGNERTEKYFPDHKSFIAASYVKAVEGSGARVIPIAIDQDDDYYK